MSTRIVPMGSFLHLKFNYLRLSRWHRFPRFGMDYSTKTRSELARVLYKRKMALTNDQATLKKLEHRLAEVKVNQNRSTSLTIYATPSTSVTHTKFRIGVANVT